VLKLTTAFAVVVGDHYTRIVKLRILKQVMMISKKIWTGIAGCVLFAAIAAAQTSNAAQTPNDAQTPNSAQEPNTLTPQEKQDGW